MPKKESDPAKKGKYDASAISVLEGLDPVRKRPGMYIGTTGPDGLHHLIWEVFDNSRDEAMGDFADRVEVVLLPGGYVRVADNGRGIPVDMHKQSKRSALETILTTLHAGGKFGGEGYKVSGGLHGVGVSVVNALSTHLIAEVHRDGGYFIQEYQIGVPKAKVKKIGPSKLQGTVITFQADESVFKEVIFDYNRIVSHLRQQAYLVKGMRLSVIDARELSEAEEKKLNISGKQFLAEEHLEVPHMHFYFEGGLRSLVAFNNQHQKPVHKNIFYIEKNDVDEQVLSVEVALQYVDDISARITAFANNIYNPEHGTHITGFKTALTRTLNNYARKANVIKEKDTGFTGEDVLEGITAVVSVKMPEIQFEGQTKAKLGSVEARSAVESVFGEAFAMYLEENPDDAKAIMNKVVLAVKARKAAKAAKDSVLRKGALDGMSLPGKLADCQSKRAEDSELFIVEGDSAGGCFSGDTKVALTDGRDVSFKDLVKERAEGKQHYCYTIGDDGRVAIGEVRHPRITKRDAEVMNVVLDTGEKIQCTPDHRFMLRDGSYKEAKDLVASDSLMPLYRKLSERGGRITIDGYEMVYDPADRYWIFTHLLSDRFNQTRGVYERTDGDHVHHIDFNKLNNDPDNLMPLSKEDHMKLHSEHASRTLHTEAAKEKARRVHKTTEYRQKIRNIMTTPEMRRMLSRRAKKQWEDDTYKAYMVERFLEFYHSNDVYRKETKTRLNKAQQEYWGDPENRKKQAERVAAFFKENPELREELRTQAHKQWNDTELRAWRSEETKKQWTPEFRRARKQAYDQTYLNKMLDALHSIYAETGSVDLERYEQVRATTGDRSLIRPQTVADRFFGGSIDALKEAAIQHNHRVKAVEQCIERIDVYDIEVPGTHNFALASGVFVHNSAKMGRDRKTQAVLPLRGKILNVERARIDKMLASEQIKNLVIALGTAIGDVFDESKLRYHKLIIATDADVDGAHIRTLLLTLFFRYFRPLVDGGYIYIAQPPLYKIQKGKDVQYAFTDAEKFNILGVDAPAEDEIDDEEAEETETAEDQEADMKRQSKVRIQRYKGLGEMNSEELWETTMNPEHRILKRVTVEDAQEADRVFDILMGTDVASRKSFIQSNARTANLDI
ncbi:MAG: toprim domain-containing protein [Candidatus Paceibacterota bacterium]